MWWTLTAAFLGASTALIIAFGAYPWQKRKDRELQIATEARQAATTFVDDVIRAGVELMNSDVMSDQVHIGLNQSLHRLHFYFGESEISSARSYVECMVDLAKMRKQGVSDDEFLSASEKTDLAGFQFIKLVKARYHGGYY